MERRRRSILKALSWRLTATVTTILIVYVFTGKAALAVGVGAVEMISKICLFYIHERAWNTISWGRRITNYGLRWRGNL